LNCPDQKAAASTNQIMIAEPMRGARVLGSSRYASVIFRDSVR
jgi:hypothetical protein